MVVKSTDLLHFQILIEVDRCCVYEDASQDSMNMDNCFGADGGVMATNC